jgi:hypothetical protein
MRREAMSVRVSRASVIAMFLVVGFMALDGRPAGGAVPTADEILQVLGFSEAEQSRVAAGEFVGGKIESTSDRDLVAAYAFQVPGPPSRVSRALQEQLDARTDPDTIASGTIAISPTLESFADLTLAPDTASRVRAYLQAKPGWDLNLSAAEIAVFHDLQSRTPGPDSSEVLVTQQVRRLLLARTQTYLENGLDGIEPYARKSGEETPAAGDLRRATDAARHLKNYLPEFHALLGDYPAAPPSGFQERFEWLVFMSRGTPVFILMHNFSMPEGDAFVHVQRQFYVSAAYNVEQAIAAVLPSSAGSLVIYSNHFSTDQITGFGKSAKRAVGQRIMGKQLQAFFERVRSAAATPAH